MSHAAHVIDFAHVPIPFVRRCLLWRGARRIEAVTCNVSAWGAYVTFMRLPADVLLRAGDPVQIAFLLPEDPIPVTSHGVVSWRRVAASADDAELPPGCSVRFVALRAKDRHRVGRLVHDYRHAVHPRLCVPRPRSGPVRIPYVRPCLLAVDGASLPAVLCNLSLAGAYVAVDPLPAVGQHVSVRFAAGSAPIETPCEVAWVNPDGHGRCQRLGRRTHRLPPGCGLRFLDVSVDAHRRVDALLRAYESWPRVGL